ncbi:MAG: acetyl-CoA hydrolase/transferase family protein [Alphaproteobacteria bacterium]
MTNHLRAAAIPGLLKPGMSVFVQGGAAEPTVILDALKAAPDRAAGVTFTQPNVPSVNRRDLAALHQDARCVALFATRDNDASLHAGKVRLLPLHYSDAHGYLTRRAKFDLAIVQVSPPDAQGWCSFGVAGDMVPDVLERSAAIVAEINPAIPVSPGAPRLAYDRIGHAVEAGHPLLEMANPPLNDTLATLGRNVAGLVYDGDTIEFGLGGTPNAVLAALCGKRDIGVHTGLATDSLIDLIEAGVVTNARKPIDTGKSVTGLAIGTRRLYDALGAGAPVDFRPVSYTHDRGVIAWLDRFVAINSVIEVDLFGQANAEMIGGRQVSGTGGLLDFVEAARRASHGRSILALQSTASDGKTSRIVPALTSGTVVTVPRAEADYVVTEHGVASLRDRSVDERAEALIAIAAPHARDGLLDAWRKLRPGRAAR